jgi:hypothetical protein
VGYITDSYQLVSAGTVLTPVTTPGAVVTGSASQQYAGADFDRAVIRVTVSAVSSPTITDWGVFLQDSDGTNWFPDLANRTEAAGYMQFGTSAPSAGQHFQAVVSAFPGNTFRLGIYAVGSAGTITVAATGDFEKRVPDAS